MPDRAPGELAVLLVLAQSTGGIGRHVRTLATSLAERDVQVTLAAPPDSIDTLGLAELGLPVVRAPLGRAAPPALLNARRVVARAAAQCDVVHAHGLRAGASSAAARTQRPLVVTWHNAPQGGPAWRLSHAILRRYVARRADLTLAASEDLAADARAAGGLSVRTTFVSAPPLGPAVRSPDQVRAELGVGDRPLVIAVGRLHRQKRLDVLVAAAAGWATAPGAPQVVIAGDGPAREELVAQARESRAPVTLLGERTDVADLLGAADVVALPSEWEARSLVAQEALRAGVPLVTTPVGGLPALVGEAALLVPVGDAAALRGAIESLLADRAMRQRIVALGLARASSWPTPEQTIDELLGSYLDLKERSRL